MAGRHHDDDKAEHPLVAVGAGLFMLLILGALIWLVASNRIVYGSLKPALFFAAIWKLWASDYSIGQWNEVVTSATRFALRPSEVSFVSWMQMMSVAYRPFLGILMSAYVVALVFLARNRKTFMRRFTATRLMEHAVQRFSGVAPVVAIRKQIAKNKHPLWRRQVTPEEVFLNYKVTPSVRSLCAAGSPMVRDGKFDREVARTYFMGLQKENGSSLMRSSTLGRQVVDLLNDTRHEHAVVFSDRMSAEGKTLLALWAAVAFGGVEGREEFCRYRDLLNRSAYGTADGMANLALAQPLYDKYRKHPMLNKMFAIHHWEHTALFFLLSLAQRKGRFTTAEVLWLRPTNRVMFFALNSRGSYTPHTEAAATFVQYMYESQCAKQGRLPLVRDAEGRLMHMIYVDKAIDGLELEYARWAEGSDDEEDWWLAKDVWKRTNTTINQEFARIAAATPEGDMPGAAGQTPFDLAASRQAQEQASAEARALEEDLGKLFGSSGSSLEP